MACDPDYGCWHDQPQALGLDNRSEFLADRFAVWFADRSIVLRYIQLDQLNQNAFLERFNRAFRHEVLDTYEFDSLDQMCEISAAWVREYNEEWPHDTLDGIAPSQFRAQQTIGSSLLPLFP